MTRFSTRAASIVMSAFLVAIIMMPIVQTAARIVA